MNDTESISALSLSDEENVKKVLAGEKGLYENIMRKYNQRLYRISMSIVNDSSEAEDIMQASYIKAYEHLADFQFKSGFGTWLTRILINESLARVKRKKRVEEIGTKELHSMPNNESPLQKIMNKELKDILEKALTQLPQKYRVVFVMREVEEMNTNETMECLHLSESNVKTRLNRAKEMLRTSLSGYYKNNELYNFHLTRCNKITENVMNYIFAH